MSKFESKNQDIKFYPSITELYAVQWSPSQKNFDILRVGEMLVRSLEIYREGEASDWNDWICVYIGKTLEDAQNAIIDLESRRQ
jgi:hypothetical protein